MQIKWLSPGSHRHPTVAEKKELITAATPKPRRLTISLLTFGTFDQCARLLLSLCQLLYENSDLSSLTSLKISVLVRNNNPRLDSGPFDRQWQELIKKYDRFQFLMFNDGLNVGFGMGHNLSFDAVPCDYFLVLNDDIGFPDVDWLATALAILETDTVVAAVGAASNPGSITPFYANGTWAREWHRWPLRYVEGSVMLLRASVFAEVGKFDPAYEWALFEDTDLSFRIQAMGYRLEWIDIPHEHWRASSFNVLPSGVKGAILEHNRSVFYSKWNASINEGRIGRFQIFDLWSLGIGDIFIACLHLKSYLSGLTETQKSTIIVNTSAPDVARLILGDDIDIQSVADRDRLAASYSEMGVRSLNSLRSANYALPFNIHALICGALGIPVATGGHLSSAMNDRRRKPGENPPAGLPQEPYCVCHLESERGDHDGRSPSPMTTALIASLAAEVFQTIVLVGRNKHLAFDMVPDARIVDLRGRLSISALIDVISGADTFVGIDSFPAHIAQVMSIKSVVFFGSVHPLFRVLSAGQTWPIAKAIDCIGCYHTFLEPTLPFCMRRDLSCTKDIPSAEIRTAMESCAALEAFDWRVLELRALELQQKFLMKMFFHPDSQRRFLNVTGTSQMATTTLIETVIEQVRGHLLAGGDHHAMASSIQQLDDAKREVHRKDVQIESMIRLIADLRAGDAH